MGIVTMSWDRHTHFPVGLHCAPELRHAARCRTQGSSAEASARARRHGGGWCHFLGCNQSVKVLLCWMLLVCLPKGLGLCRQSVTRSLRNPEQRETPGPREVQALDAATRVGEDAREGTYGGGGRKGKGILSF